MSANVSASPGDGGGSSSTPGTSSTHHGGVMDCSSNPAQFTLVSIHTAKCAKCDKRNMDRMRRCPGCTYQVCQPCFDNMNGAPLTHGNVDSSPAGINSAPVRRRLFTRAGAPSLSTTASSSTVLLSGGSGTAEGGPVIETNASGNSGTDQTVDTAKVDAADTDVGVQEPSAQVTPRPSVKRTRKAKVKTYIADQSSSEDEFVLDLESPTPAQKRRRAIDEMKGEESGDKLTNIHSRRSDKAPIKANATSAPSTKMQTTQLSSGQNLSSSATSNNSRGRIGTGFLIQKGEEDEVENDGILGREQGEGTIQQLLEKHGVDRPGNRYKEHLLSRREPVLCNPIIPLNLGQSYNPRRGDMGNEGRPQDRVAQKLQKLHDSLNEANQGGFVTVKQATLPKISELVKTKAIEVIQDLKLTEDQEAAVQAHAMASASLLIVKFNCERATSVQHRPKLELGTSSVAHLDSAMIRELKDKIEEDILLLLNYFNPPDNDDSDTNGPTKVHLSFKPDVPGALPPVGKFQVSPIRPRSRPLTVGLTVGSSSIPSCPFDSSSTAMHKQGGSASVNANAADVSFKAKDDLSFSPDPLNA